MAVALPFIAIAAAAGGSLLKGISSAESASYSAQVARNNAQIARQNEGYTASATAAQVEQEGLVDRARNANVRASIGANNLDVNSGSPAAVQLGDRTLGALDVATVANKGAQQVYGYATQATDYTAQAAADQAQVGPDIAEGVLGAVGSAAGGTQNVPGLGSLLSGQPSVPSDYEWMQGSGQTASATSAGGLF